MLANQRTLYYNNTCVANIGICKSGPLAQLVEHLTLNQGVQGSNPWRSTKYRF